MEARSARSPDKNSFERIFTSSPHFFDRTPPAERTAITRVCIEISFGRNHMYPVVNGRDRRKKRARVCERVAYERPRVTPEEQ